MVQKSITIVNKEEKIGKVTKFVREYAEKTAFSDDLRGALAVVFDEMLSNVIHHGFKDNKEHLIKITLDKKGKDFIGIIEDDGMEFNPLKHPEADVNLSIKERPLGGLGIFLVRKIMDDVKYKRIGNKNVITLFKTDD